MLNYFKPKNQNKYKPMKTTTKTFIASLLLGSVPAFAQFDADSNLLPDGKVFAAPDSGSLYISGKAGLMGGSFKPSAFSDFKLDTLGSAAFAVGYQPNANFRFEVEIAGASGDLKEGSDGMNEIEYLYDLILLEGAGAFTMDIKGETSIFSVTAQAYYLTEIAPNFNLMLNAGVGMMKADLEFSYDIYIATRYSGGTLYGNYYSSESTEYSANFLYASVGGGLEWMISNNLSLSLTGRYVLSQEKDMDGLKAKPDLYAIYTGLTFTF